MFKTLYCVYTSDDIHSDVPFTQAFSVLHEIANHIVGLGLNVIELRVHSSEQVRAKQLVTHLGMPIKITKILDSEPKNRWALVGGK